MKVILKLLFVLCLISIESFSQQACLQTYRSKSEGDLFKNWSTLKNTFIESGIAKEMNSIKIEFLDGPMNSSTTQKENDQLKNSNDGLNPVERFIKILYNDNTGNAQT